MIEMEEKTCCLTLISMAQMLCFYFTMTVFTTVGFGEAYFLKTLSIALMFLLSSWEKAVAPQLAPWQCSLVAQLPTNVE
jgi:hypothetical protein